MRSQEEEGIVKNVLINLIENRVFHLKNQIALPHAGRAHGRVETHLVLRRIPIAEQHRCLGGIGRIMGSR